MAEYSTKIKEYCKANGVSNVDFLSDVRLKDDSDGNGAYISEWNLDIAQPTSEQIESYETVANETEANTPSTADLKASAKAKLIAGEALTEEEANTIVL
jgi:hypothetical protein|tara:strand:- start:204 stop:500 length:297 start_codon:yes stop_codon:yes gene_type:complete